MEIKGEGKIKMKKILALILVVLMTVSLAACASAPDLPTSSGGASGGSSSGGSTAGSTEDDRFFVGVTFNGLDAVPALMKLYMEEMFDEKGWEYFTTNADLDASKQLSDVENLLQKDPDVILGRYVAAQRPSVLKLCDEAGVPAMAMSMGMRYSLTPEEDALLLTGVGDSEWVRGIPLAYWLLDYMEANPDFVPKIGTVVGNASGDMIGQTHRTYDFMRTMQANGKEEGKDYHIVARTEAVPNWSTAGGMKVVEDWLSLYSIDELNTIYCWSDEMVVGVIQALQGAGKQPGEYIVMSFDGLEIVHEYVEQGWLQVSSAYDFKKQCTRIVEVLEMIKDGKIDEIKPIEFAQSIFVLTPENIAAVKAGNIEYFEYTAEMELEPRLKGSDWYPESAWASFMGE